jgi:hypothetical protein
MMNSSERITIEAYDVLSWQAEDMSETEIIEDYPKERLCKPISKQKFFYL